MPYEARNGFDFLIDYYSIAGAEHEPGIPPDLATGELSRLLRERSAEYHPDRLEKMAKELREIAERKSKHLTDARTILLNEGRRKEYDDLLRSWTGPISADGTPVITLDRQMLGEYSLMTADEVESAIGKIRRDTELGTGYSPSNIDLLEGMISAAGNDVPPALRELYEHALLTYDRVLATEDDYRSELVGRARDEERRVIVGFDYADKVAVEIDAAREARIAELKKFAVISAGGRLALLAGETTEPVSSAEVVQAPVNGLPAYYEPQVEKLSELAAERQVVARKRLANLFPTYLDAELQTEQLPGLVIRFMVDDLTQWFNLYIDQVSDEVYEVEMPDHLLELLSSGDFRTVINQGYNVVSVNYIVPLDFNDILGEVIQKHINKYRSETDPE